MTKQKIKKKTGGRTKGTPNKKTEDFFERCAQQGHDPILFNILVAKNDWQALGYESGTVTVFTKSGDSYEQDRISIADRISANNKLLDFMYPKRKAVEHSVSDESRPPIVLAYSDSGLKRAAELDEQD